MTPNDAPPEPPLARFHSYADDTPREAAGAQSRGLDEPPGERPHGRSRRLVFYAGAGLAIIAGVVLAHRDSTPTAAPSGPASPPATGAPMKVEVAPLPAPSQAPTAPLDVLPPETFVRQQAAEPAPRPYAVSPPPEAPAPPPPASVVPPPPRATALAVPPAAADAVATAPSQPAFDCGHVRSLAEDMVCHDRRLAAADRRMARAFVEALAAGADERALREDQSDWLAIREDAAHHSADAVASIYNQRIRELEAMADGPRR